MKRRVLAGLVVALCACGGSAGSDFLAVTDDDGGTSSGGISSFPGQDGGAAGDAGTNGPPRTDAGTRRDGEAPPPPPLGDAGVPDGTSPGTIACGTATCPLATDQCCVQQDGTAACQARGTTCPGATLRCDDPSDCTGENVCCYQALGTTLTSVCTKDCNGDNGSRVRACTSTQQCSSCAVHACVEAGVPSVETCAPIPGVCP